MFFSTFFIENDDPPTLTLTAIESTTSGGKTFHTQCGAVHNEYIVDRFYKDKVHTKCIHYKKCPARLTFLVKNVDQDTETPNTVDNFEIKQHSHTTKCKGIYFFKFNFA